MAQNPAGKDMENSMVVVGSKRRIPVHDSGNEHKYDQSKIGKESMVYMCLR
jgi:hypothetical protein